MQEWKSHVMHFDSLSKDLVQPGASDWHSLTRADMLTPKLTPKGTTERGVPEILTITGPIIFIFLGLLLLEKPCLLHRKNK